MQPSNPFIVDNSESGWTGFDTSKTGAISRAVWILLQAFLRSVDCARPRVAEIRENPSGNGGRDDLSHAGCVHHKIQIRATVSHPRASLNRNWIGASKRGKYTSVEDGDPFLRGVPAILEALQSGKIECRIHNKRKFHAKAYICCHHEVIGAKALVGSSNFTHPGLTRNVELNVQIQSGKEVDHLQEWFENYWEESEEVTPELAEVDVTYTSLPIHRVRQIS